MFLFESLLSLILLGMVAKVWYAIPLIVVVSLCYGATRHETTAGIAYHSFRTFIWVVGFMGLIFLIVWLSGYFI